jgi:hypothetical protein
MSYLKGVLQEEFSRLKALAKKYQSEISLLPHGSVSIKKRNKKDYLYLASRQKDKVKFKYIGPISSDGSKKMIKKIESRKQYEDKLKEVNADIREIEKVLNGRKI